MALLYPAKAAAGNQQQLWFCATAATTAYSLMI